MHHEQVEQAVARKSAQIYISLSMGAAVLFFLLASITGDYTDVARFGGAFWVGLLTLIIAMPIVTSQVKSRSLG
jgi:cation transport ATPase